MGVLADHAGDRSDLARLENHRWKVRRVELKLHEFSMFFLHNHVDTLSNLNPFLIFPKLANHESTK